MADIYKNDKRPKLAQLLTGFKNKKGKKHKCIIGNLIDLFPQIRTGKINCKGILVWGEPASIDSKHKRFISLGHRKMLNDAGGQYISEINQFASRLTSFSTITPEEEKALHTLYMLKTIPTTDPAFSANKNSVKSGNDFEAKIRIGFHKLGCTAMHRKVPFGFRLNGSVYEWDVVVLIRETLLFIEAKAQNTTGTLWEKWFANLHDIRAICSQFLDH